MTIKEISISNFRVYGETSSLTFNSTSQKPVIMIGGRNGFGKSTFITSVLWCLYGKLISHVEDNFERLIRISGGYKKFLAQSANKSSNSKDFFVELTLINVSLPALRCNELRIKRHFLDDNEKLEILIDGEKNDLVESIGYDLFIQEHILPKEVARFFLFDAERITSIAESKGVTERRLLGSAYDKVLGVQKYIEIKSQLETMYERTITENSTKEDRKKLKSVGKLINELETKIEELVKKKEKSELKIIEYDAERERLSQKLMSLGFLGDASEIEKLKGEEIELKEQMSKIKTSLQIHLQTLPFIFTTELLNQLIEDKRNESISISANTKNEIQNTIDYWAIKHNISNALKIDLFDHLDSTFKHSNKIKNNPSHINIEELDLISSKIKWLKQWITEQHIHLSRCKGNLNKIRTRLLKLNDSGSNLDVYSLREKISLLDIDKTQVLSNKLRFELEVEALEKELNAKQKLRSELLKIVGVDSRNKIKVTLLENLIRKTTLFIDEFKNSRKENLENRITLALKEILHKPDLVNSVKINLAGGEMDLKLYNRDLQIVPKDSLSMGEKQLYAISLLKALIDESGMEFPVIIDSPLQKLDPNHSDILLNKIFPELSEQVFVLPLPGKEFTEQEYNKCMHKINSLHLIHHSNNCSKLSSVNSEEFFQNTILLNK